MTKTDRKKRKKQTPEEEPRRPAEEAPAEPQSAPEAPASAEEAGATADAAEAEGQVDGVNAVGAVDCTDGMDGAGEATGPGEPSATDGVSATGEAAAPDEPHVSTEFPTSIESIGSAESTTSTEATLPPSAVVETLDFTTPPAPDEEEPEAEPLETDLEVAAVEEIREGGDASFKSLAEIKAAIECLLFTTPHPLTQQKIRQLVGGIDLRTLRGILVQLQAEYDARASGLMILEGAEGFQMCTRPQYADVVLHLHRQRKKNPLSPTALETLAIVAYKQPITRAEIEMIRGVESSGVLRNLADMGLVEVVGRKEVIGRPQMYGTTALFLRTFGLRTLAELPTIQNLRRQFEPPKMSMFSSEPEVGATELVPPAAPATQDSLSAETVSEEPTAGVVFVEAAPDAPASEAARPETADAEPDSSESAPGAVIVELGATEAAPEASSSSDDAIPEGAPATGAAAASVEAPESSSELAVSAEPTPGGVSLASESLAERPAGEPASEEPPAEE